MEASGRLRLPRTVDLAEIRRDGVPRLRFVANALAKSGSKFGRRAVFRDVEYLASRYGLVRPVRGEHGEESREQRFWAYARLAVRITALDQTLGRLRDRKVVAGLGQYLADETKRLEKAWPVDSALWKTKHEAASVAPAVLAVFKTERVFENPWARLEREYSRSKTARGFRELVARRLIDQFNFLVRTNGVSYSMDFGLVILGDFKLAATFSEMLDWLNADDVGKCKGCGAYFVRRTRHKAMTCSERCRKRNQRKESDEDARSGELGQNPLG